jgi:hypothetical protein
MMREFCERVETDFEKNALGPKYRKWIVTKKQTVEGYKIL